MHDTLELFVAIPVAIRLLRDDAALDQQPLQDQLNIKFSVFGISYSQRDIFEIAEIVYVLR
jgi:hypothetical protein